MILDTKSRRFKAVDLFYIIMMILPILAGIVLQVLTDVPAEGISITGARVFFTVDMPLQDLIISEAQINSWLVIVFLLFFCLYMTHGITAVPGCRRQLLAEWAVETCDRLVEQNMGPFFRGYGAFIIAILGISGVSSLLSLVGLFPPTSDVNVVGGWAILVFALITFYKLHGGLKNYLKGFTEPIVVLLPLNILGEVATPLSLAFRHYGNVLSGSVIAVLISTALQGLSQLLLGWLPGLFGEIPFLQVGLPAILSLYFDIFSGCLQAFIFAMLTMLNISGGFPEDEYEKRRLRKLEKKKAKQ